MKTRTSIYQKGFAYAYVLLAAVIFCSCSGGSSKDANEWIKKAEKPIICKQQSINLMTCKSNWTLIDANGNIYETGMVSLSLPDTIYGSKK